MRFVIRLVVLVLTALLIAACGDDDEPVTAGAGDPAGGGGDTIEGRYVATEVAEPDLDLVGTIWLVDGYLDRTGPDAAVSSATGDTARLVFDGTGLVTGNDGCNDFGYAGEPGQEPTDGLRYELDGDHITFTGAAVTTDIACPDVDTDRFWAVLSGTVTWNIDRSRLTMLDETGTGITYRAQP